LEKGEELYVAAGESLDEVFTNVISNSVKYTNSKEVYLDIEVEEIIDHPLNPQ
jgi:signal transduction histidine kinase